MQEIFYGPGPGHESMLEKQEREAKARSICAMCPYRLSCLEIAIVWKDIYGVWGGMSEAERRQFMSHLRSEGYGSELPTGLELEATIRSYYRSRQRRLRTA